MTPRFQGTPRSPGLCEPHVGGNKALIATLHERKLRRYCDWWRVHGFVDRFSSGEAQNQNAGAGALYFPEPKRQFGRRLQAVQDSISGTLYGEDGARGHPVLAGTANSHLSPTAGYRGYPLVWRPQGEIL